ncbi:hypothetical protein CCACVL1_01554 [Corchorus capsularis]|uniref:Uncharacterized protein n=1 Tax=Corchorus capsularis TaxID=210143 RepID=A0A1R3KHA1_COCAP|nr:hypothetical protein CCACVL1_01554 [Corchorus capsularis]
MAHPSHGWIRRGQNPGHYKLQTADNLA